MLEFVPNFYERGDIVTWRNKFFVIVYKKILGCSWKCKNVSDFYILQTCFSQKTIGQKASFDADSTTQCPVILQYDSRSLWECVFPRGKVSTRFWEKKVIDHVDRQTFSCWFELWLGLFSLEIFGVACMFFFASSGEKLLKCCCKT